MRRISILPVIASFLVPAACQGPTDSTLNDAGSALEVPSGFGATCHQGPDCTFGTSPYCLGNTASATSGWCTSGCNTDSDCGSGLVCVRSASTTTSGSVVNGCFLSCTANAACPNSFACDDTATDTSGSQVMICALGCMSDADCAEGTCDPTSGACVSPSGGCTPFTDGSFESPLVPVGAYSLFATGQSFGPWLVVGAEGNVGPISTSFSQGGFTLPAEDGAQYMDLTGTSNSATGVQQTFSTVPGATYDVTFWVGNVYDPGGIGGTSSTVQVFIDGASAFSFTNNAGAGTSTTAWESTGFSFVASSSSTQISFVNGDPPTDTANFLDNITISGPAGCG